ncbi:hypothetical protein [Bosea sp. (in: a-proteobacteria)]|uniref:hypothetical protein n=1 Tax=Bosea sp. (in: a-proteobacteria) TaxID=1871050 RepID=UPI002FC86080
MIELFSGRQMFAGRQLFLGRRAWLVLPALAVALAGCGSSRSTGEPSAMQKFGNIIAFQSTTPPPVNQLPGDPEEELICPAVIIAEGGAAIRAQSGPDGASLRHQISINTVARECNATGPGGGFNLKVGVEGRVLAGRAGGAGSFGATLTTQVVRNGQIIARRASRVGATIPSGQTGADFVHVEDNIVVPAGSGETEIVVSLGTGGAESARRRRR